MIENVKRCKRFFKDIGKIILTRKYKISPEKVFDRNRYYIIRRNSPWAGFFANYLYVAAHMEYALSKGYTPVVDMENYKTYYNEDGYFDGTLNAWEYYFEQPKDKCLSDAYKSGNYILSDFSTMHKYLPYYEGHNTFSIDWDKAQKLCIDINKYIRVKENILVDVQRFIDVNFRGQKILGVHYRGTDKKVQVKDHYLAVGLDKYIDTVKKCMCEYLVEGILICTDDKEAIERFEKEFPKLVFYSDVYRAEADDVEGIHIKKGVDRKNHNYLLGYEVLVDTLLLSKCNYFVFSHSNIANAALFINHQKYDKWFFVDN